MAILKRSCLSHLENKPTHSLNCTSPHSYYFSLNLYYYSLISWKSFFQRTLPSSLFTFPVSTQRHITPKWGSFCALYIWTALHPQLWHSGTPITIWQLWARHYAKFRTAMTWVKKVMLNLPWVTKLVKYRSQNLNSGKYWVGITKLRKNKSNSFYLLFSLKRRSSVKNKRKIMR